MKKFLLASALIISSLGLYSQSTIWQPYNSNIDTTYGITYLSVVDTNTVWAVGYYANGNNNFNTTTKWFTRTENGSTFIPGTFLPDTNTYNASSITAVNDSVAYITCYVKSGNGRSGIVRKTTDRGLTWNNCTDTTTMFTGVNNFPDWTHFYNNNFGIVLGDPNPYFEIYHTHNGGISWTRVPQANIPAAQTNEYGETNVYTTYGNKFIWFGTEYGGSAGTPHIYRSNDTGHTWQSATVPGMLGGVSHIAFRDSLHGMILGLSNYSNGQILLKKTSDGGITWTPVTIGNNVGCNDICAIPNTKGFMSVGPDSARSQIITSVTYDDGLTWIVLESSLIDLENMSRVHMLDSLHGWAGSYSDNTLPKGNYGMDKFTTCAMTITPNTDPICVGTSASLFVGGASGMTYTWMPSGTIGSTINDNPLSTTVYSVSGTGATCSSKTTFTLYVNPTPTVTAVATLDTICNLNATLLSGTGATTYSWIPSTSLNSSTGTTVTAHPNSTTIYTVTGTTAGCSNVATVTLTILPCVGINQLSANGNLLNIFPNPSSNNITIQSSTELGTVSIYNSLGEKVIETKEKNQETTIDISHLAAGVYTVQAQSTYVKLIKE